LSAAIYSVDEHFSELFNLNVIAGRNFSSDYSVDTKEAAILNETAIERLGIPSPQEAIGSLVEIKRTGATHQVIGVVEDFQFDFLWNPISPMIMLNNPTGYRVANIHLAQAKQAAILQNLESVWKQLEPVVPFNYRYYQDEIDAVYTDFRELVFLGMPGSISDPDRLFWYVGYVSLRYPGAHERDWCSESFWRQCKRCSATVHHRFC
jgi:putative ABC transport system permease protein